MKERMRLKAESPILKNDQSAKERLLEAGIDLFAEKGYARTSVREIVARAGVTKPVLYYYFKNKAGILRAILDRAATEQDVMLAEAAGKTGMPLDRILELYRRIYRRVLQRQNLFKLLHNLIFGPRPCVPGYDVEQFHNKMVNAIKGIYLDGHPPSKTREQEAEDAATLVLSLMDYCFHMDEVCPEASDAERAERLLQLAFRGLASNFSS